MKTNLELYKVFYYVAKNKNITQAANELMVSQPAVSKSIKVLERDLDTVLFNRNKDGVTLNSAGELLFNKIKKAELLLLDDIGAETVTEWGRDEVLGTILQYRMEENLPTFFTSNLTVEELSQHLSTTSREVDLVKAKRIIERIKQLTDDITMISVNLRKWGNYE